MKRKNIILVFLLSGLFFANSCEKPPVTNVENPLTDLPWLKAKVEEFNLLFQENPDLSVAIYQCKYGNNETGFLIDESNTKPFYNWNGEVLCIIGGVAGETCSELNIDFANKKLIWKMGNDFINNSCEFNNPLTDLPWLKTKIKELKSYYWHTEIYQCKYGNNETGFLIDEGNTKPFYNCNGEILCIMGGVAGETCSELNIDFANKKLIWEINYPIETIAYVIGYDVNCGVEIQGETAKANQYVLVSENLKDTMLTNNLPDNLFTFPAEIMPQNIFGFNLFPEKYRYVYKIQMTYRPKTKEELIFCPGHALYPMLYYFEPTQIVITSISKIQ
jgi:hypothetical protein